MKGSLNTLRNCRNLKTEIQASNKLIQLFLWARGIGIEYRREPNFKARTTFYGYQNAGRHAGVPRQIKRVHPRVSRS